jgi:hypothetical protein
MIGIMARHLILDQVSRVHSIQTRRLINHSTRTKPALSDLELIIQTAENCEEFEKFSGKKPLYAPQSWMQNQQTRSGFRARAAVAESKNQDVREEAKKHCRYKSSVGG